MNDKNNPTSAETIADGEQSVVALIAHMRAQFGHDATAAISSAACALMSEALSDKTNRQATLRQLADLVNHAHDRTGPPFDGSDASLQRRGAFEGAVLARRLIRRGTSYAALLQAAAGVCTEMIAHASKAAGASEEAIEVEIERLHAALAPVVEQIELIAGAARQTHPGEETRQ